MAVGGKTNGWVPMHRRERRGALVLALLCLLTGLAPYLLDEPYVPPADATVRLEWLADSLPARAYRDTLPDPPDTLFAFDPNTVDSLGLVKLGLPLPARRNWLRYRRAGGRFREAGDLARIYGLSEGQVARLRPFVRFETDRPVQRLPALRPFPFDPNRVSLEELLRMGLPDRVARTWTNYRRGGGYFATADAIQRVYGLREEWFEALKPYIRIEDPPEARTPRTEPRGREKPVLSTININRADRSDWEALPGIGSVLAGRILRFREALGGFYAIEQVGQTYGLPDSTFQRLRARLRPPEQWRRWPVNRLPADSLARHPYLDRRQARALVAYRQQHGPFQRAADLYRLHLLNDSTVHRLSPYLDFGLEE